MFKLYIIRLLSVCWPIFNKTLWIQNAGKTIYRIRYKMLWRHNLLVGKKNFFSEHSHIIYHSNGLSLLIIFYYKTMIWKSRRKEIFHIFFTSVIRKKCKASNHCIEIRWRQVKRRQFLFIWYIIFYMKQKWQV